MSLSKKSTKQSWANLPWWCVSALLFSNNKRSWSQRSRLSRDNLVIFDIHVSDAIERLLVFAGELYPVRKRVDVCVTNNPFRTDCHLCCSYSLLDCVNQFVFEQLDFSAHSTPSSQSNATQFVVFSSALWNFHQRIMKLRTQCETRLKPERKKSMMHSVVDIELRYQHADAAGSFKY